MRNLVAFFQATLDGYVAGPGGDLGWAHSDDPEFQEFVQGNARSGGMLLFGRRTYQMMSGFWPTPMAMERDPIVAERMNALPKVVFSRTLDEATWNNTTLVKGDLATEVRAMKSRPGEHMAILGSVSIVAQLAQAGLIDEYQVVVNPIVLGSGLRMFEGIETRLHLKLVSERTFRNGNVLLIYNPAP
ncbi:MAG: dihydrofolate reductase family protein [Bacteroidetes bacterium]|nr:dihydrofolate reductase family protein [Bacteroidota bacterium]